MTISYVKCPKWEIQFNGRIVNIAERCSCPNGMRKQNELLLNAMNACTLCDLPNMQIPWNGTIPDGGTSYCFDLAELVNSFCTKCAISMSREKPNIIWYKISSNTKYWSSLVAVNCTSLNTNLSTIRSILITFDFRNSQCSIS